MTKIQCFKCSNIAIWQYTPNKSLGYFCDDCVPRGCSCNRVLKPGFTTEINLSTGEIKVPPEECWVQELDDQGRELPCCEYDWCKEGFDSEN